MPPKKKVAEERKVILGRPSNNVKIGIGGFFLSLSQPVAAPSPLHVPQTVGLPNVGKSSTFNLLSGLSVPAENVSGSGLPLPQVPFPTLTSYCFTILVPVLHH